MNRTPRILLAAPMLVIALAGAACQARRVVAVSPPPADRPPAARALTGAVILVSIDGLRPDAIAKYKATTLSRLIAEGSSTMSARTIMPSKTLPSHTSMLTGELPECHGVLWNNGFSRRSSRITIPTVFSEARSHGYTTAAFFSKSKFSHLQQQGTLDFSQAPGGWFGLWSASKTMADVESHLVAHAPALLFVHLPDPDAAGHSRGWMTGAYGNAVKRADEAVARLLVAADRAYGAGRYTIIVTADHGGHDQGHGSDDIRDVTIPWIAWGQGVAAGRLPDGSITTTDTAATVLYLLGIDRPASWSGAAVTAAFSGALARRP
jgi:predicted AlkP superfamily pyrophosphatase or phosphodiesterase